MDEKQESEHAGAERRAFPQDLSFLGAMADRVRTVEIRFHDDHASRALSAGDTAPSGVPSGVEARLSALEAEIATVRRLIENAVLAPGQPPAAAAAHPLDPLAELKNRAAAAATCLALLLLAHLMIVIVYDLKTIYMLLASIVVPAATAIAFTRARRIRLKLDIAVALVVGIGAVAGMSYVTSIAESTPVLPQNSREWRETLEYVSCIALAYVTGVLVTRAWRALQEGAQLEARVKALQGLINSAVPATTAIASVIAGINGLLK